MPKSALVTGASTGIGYELSRLLASDGYQLFLVARDRDKLTRVATEMQALGAPAASVIAADLSQSGSPATVMEQLPGVVPDVLINNAGFGMMGRFAETALPIHMEMIQVNVASLVELTHRVLPAMIGRKSGRILNIASTAAFQPGPLMSVYFATKSFVLHFSEAVSQELEGTGVTLTVLCPGATDTEFQGRAKLTESKLFKKGKVMTASEVAKIGYEAMMRGETLKIAGLTNRLGVESLRLAPRSLVRKMVYSLQQP